GPAGAPAAAGRRAAGRRRRLSTHLCRGRAALHRAARSGATAPPAARLLPGDGADDVHRLSASRAALRPGDAQLLRRAPDLAPRGAYGRGRCLRLGDDRRLAAGAAPLLAAVSAAPPAPAARWSPRGRGADAAPDGHDLR